MQQTILTGIKPTGTPHLGNYFGAILPAIKEAEKFETSCFFIANYHALNSITDAEKLKKYTYEVAATWLACGLNPEKSVFYKQSDIPEVFELFSILTNVTTKGIMNRAHAYKASVDENTKNGLEPDSGINMGLYNYPILMAADIVLLNATRVPVGLDQKQHIEITKEIVRSFNNRYGNVLTMPKEIIKEEVQTVPGLDGRKMSKSYGNTIELFCSEQTLKKKIFGIVTDSSSPTSPKPLNSYIFELYKLFADEKQTADMKKKFENGISWGEAKTALFETANAYLKSMREKYNSLIADTKYLDSVLLKGAEKARKKAKKTLEKVKKAIL